MFKQLANDLKHEFPSLKGLSRSNLMSMRSFALAWPDFESNKIVQQAVGQIPWGHNILLIQKLNSENERLWYAAETIKNGWSRSVLAHQVESGLILRTGNAVNNFVATLPSVHIEMTLSHDFEVEE